MKSIICPANCTPALDTVPEGIFFNGRPLTGDDFDEYGTPMDDDGELMAIFL